MLEGRRLAAISYHLVVLTDHADEMIAGAPEPIFQPQTVVAGVHIAP
jgi:hypothetical protein